MSRRTGPTSFAAIVFAALLCVTILCVECEAAFVRDPSRSGVMSIIKASIRQIRNLMQTYQPEIHFATCAISSFPSLDPYPEPFMEFRQLPLDEPLPDTSTLSYESPSTPSSTSSPSNTSTPSSSSTPSPSSPLPPSSSFSTLSPSTSSSPSSLTTPPPSLSAPPLSLSSPSFTTFPSASSPPYSTPLTSPSPLSSSSSPSNSSNLSPPSSSSFPFFPITHSPPFPLSPFSELPSLILLESLAATGIPQDDSLFVLDLLGILFPTVFNRPVIEKADYGEEEVSRRDGKKGKENVLDAWMSAIRALLLSVISPSEGRQSWLDWIAVPVYSWNLAVPPQNRMRTLVPLQANSALRMVKKEEVEGGLLWKMWISWRKTAAKWFNRLRWWLNPGADQERTNGPKSTVIGLAQCTRTYLVDLVWRWAEEGYEGMKSKSFRLRRAIHPRIRPSLRPSTPALPSKVRVWGKS